MDINMSDDNGCTALHACVEFDLYIPLKALENRKFKTEADLDKEGLHVSDIVRLLCKHGADVTARNNNGNTLLQLALDNRVNDMVTALFALENHSEQEQLRTKDDGTDAELRAPLWMRSSRNSCWRKDCFKHARRF
ncbi:hypothetical protein BJX64DRAFT_272810 [Aspergillus heterothallicus]